MKFSPNIYSVHLKGYACLHNKRKEKSLYLHKWKKLLSFNTFNTFAKKNTRNYIKFTEMLVLLYNLCFMYVAICRYKWLLCSYISIVIRELTYNSCKGLQPFVARKSVKLSLRMNWGCGLETKGKTCLCIYLKIYKQWHFFEKKKIFCSVAYDK